MRSFNGDISAVELQNACQHILVIAQVRSSARLLAVDASLLASRFRAFSSCACRGIIHSFASMSDRHLGHGKGGGGLVRNASTPTVLPVSLKSCLVTNHYLNAFT